MSEHKMKLSWKRTSSDFNYATYNRLHLWDFDNGNTLKGTAAPEYKGDPGAVDPEQAFVGSIASCHMLTFLSIASRKGYIIDAYEDEPVGFLEKDADGKLAITRVNLSPKIIFSGKQPDTETLNKLHETAHDNCFIASSVKSKVVINEL